MNAGKSYVKARAQAQANANAANAPRYLHAYGGVWWISKTPCAGCETIEPESPSVIGNPMADGACPQCGADVIDDRCQNVGCEWERA